MAPDIAKYFAHLHLNSHGATLHPSDWADKAPDDPVFGVYRKCGFINFREAEVVYQLAKQLPGQWLDIGSHTGWSAIYMAKGGVKKVFAVDPAYHIPGFGERAVQNIVAAGLSKAIRRYACTSREFLSRDDTTFERFDGVLIDGDHDWGGPLYDAFESFQRLTGVGVIILHDFIGGPVREAVRYLMVMGMSVRVYFLSSALMAVCWFPKLSPVILPQAVADPNVDQEALKSQMLDFDFSKCV